MKTITNKWFACVALIFTVTLASPPLAVHAQPLQPEVLFDFAAGLENPYGKLVQGSDGNFYGTTAEGGNSGYGTVFLVTTNGALTTLVSFNKVNGANPQAGLVLGSDGNFYGTTYGGGSGYGTVFRVTTNGTLTTLVSFNYSNGAYPKAALTLGSDNNFYGTTFQGGASGYGTVFRVTTNGALTTLVSFNNANGARPKGALTLGSDGAFYGTTVEGGSIDLNGGYGYGTVFKITTNGVLTTLVKFDEYNGSQPQEGLTLGLDGNFYGTTALGGSGSYGTVFQVTANGQLTTLVSFNGSTGMRPMAGLALGGDGNFYGTTRDGGSSDYGTVFKVTTNGILTTLVSFDNANGARPAAALTLGGDGNFYGTTRNGGSTDAGTVFQVRTNGTLSTLLSFNICPSGVGPGGTLTLGGDGTLYGTTRWGGTSGKGTVFKMITNGVLTTLVVFNGDNGDHPQAGLTLGTDGDFYGTTIFGYDSYGTVFKMTTNGTLTRLVSFDGANGQYPFAALTLGSDGNFYGTTENGGNNYRGTIFRMTTNGKLTTLVSFNNANGAYPVAGLSLGSDGNFYGTTSRGGNTNLNHGSGYGTVFQVTTNGALTTLVSFNNANGANPQAGLTLGSDGNFYGTTFEGGLTNLRGGYGYGTVFKVTTNGILTTLVSFNNTNGANPSAALTLGSDGHFYGSTGQGGANTNENGAGGTGDGTLFQLTTSGLFSMLFSFSGNNGSRPEAGLTLGQDGNFYSTTTDGGSSGWGVIYRLTVGRPFITSQPSDQIVAAGAAVTMPVGIFGALPMSCQWTFNTTNLPGATNAVLTLNDVGFSSAGTYALRVTNSHGNAWSSNATITVVPSLVTTLPASGITATSAVLNASLTLGSRETLAWFEWGPDTDYGQIDGVTDIPGGSGTVTLGNALTGLDGDRIYHYRIVAWNSFGIVYGADQLFQVGLVPTAATLGATGITTNSVVLNAALNPGGRLTTAWFLWGTTVSYGNVTPVTSVGSGAVSSNFGSVISGLSMNTLYHCRVMASNSLGVVNGSDATFSLGAPVAATGPATFITGTNARINGRVTPNLFATTAWFEWGTNTSYGNTKFLGAVGSGSSAVSVNNLLIGLDAALTYHFRLVASNDLGTAFGTDLKFGMSPDAYAQSVLADEPLVYYRFEEASGTLAFNSALLGVPADGTYNAAVSLAHPSLAPTLGSAAEFNNTNSAVAVPALGTYPQFTIEVWANPHTFGLSGPGNSHSQYNSIYTTDTWAPGALHTHFVNLSSHYRQWQLAIGGNSPIEVYAGNSVYPPTSNSGFFPTNAWVHLAATYDSAARQMITYVNGHVYTTNVYSSAIPLNLTAAHIGAWIGPNSTANWFDGGLDEFAIYGTALPASRIQAHYQAAIGNPVLLAAQTNNSLGFSWIGPGFKLQRNPDLSNVGGWTNVIGGTNSPVSVTISNAGNQFFRLRWP